MLAISTRVLTRASATKVLAALLTGVKHWPSASMDTATRSIC